MYKVEPCTVTAWPWQTYWCRGCPEPSTLCCACGSRAGKLYEHPMRHGSCTLLACAHLPDAGLTPILCLQTTLADSIAAEAALSKARSAVHAAAEAGKLHELPQGLDRTSEREAARRSLDCMHKVKEAEAVGSLTGTTPTALSPLAYPCHVSVCLIAA